MRFVDRADAGSRLGAALRPVVADAGGDVVVVGLPRGGIPVAFEVARVLAAPLDVIVVRKLGVPHQPELAMGAVGEEGARVTNAMVLAAAGVTELELDRIERRERAEVDRRARRLRSGSPGRSLVNRTVVVVDDGIATGATARAACRIARARGAATVVLAAPVGPRDVERRIRPDADRIVCLHRPSRFTAIGQFYDDFAQVSDEQVERLLQLAPRGE